MNQTTIIGIDPGSQLAGYASADGQLSGVWTLQTDCRWADLYGRVYTLAESCPKATFAVEEPNGHFMGKGWYVQAAWGCVMAALQFRGVRVVQVTNSAAKLALTGHGNADKDHMIKAAMLHGLERATLEYWIEQYGKTYKQAFDLAATAADAYAIALAGSGRGFKATAVQEVVSVLRTNRTRQAPAERSDRAGNRTVAAQASRY